MEKVGWWGGRVVGRGFQLKNRGNLGEGQNDTLALAHIMHLCKTENGVLAGEYHLVIGVLAWLSGM